MAKTMIKVENLYHSYTKDKNYAVEDMNFEVEEGEIFGFLGPSGAGKSTTQSILMGLNAVQQGTVIMNGKPVGDMTKDDYNNIGVSFEKPNVYLKLSALENLKYHADLYSVDTMDPMQLLEIVGLGSNAKKKVGAFSKGMRQRLVFARSMINNPKIWFLDEPTSGLDPTISGQIKDIIKQKKKEGVTIFLTTHDMAVAEALCDRVAFINAGKLLAIDTPKNLKLKYGEEFVKVEYLEGENVKSEELYLATDEDKARLKEIVDTKKIQTMHSGEATLEDVFKKVTGRGLE